MPEGARELRVRMYRVGFGDCFLLTATNGAEPRHVLVDFGVHPSGTIGTLDRVMEDLAEVTQGRLAVIVATHEHADHISGFGKFAARFQSFTIGEVWMPWALDPDDPAAAALRTKRLQLADTLVGHLAAVGGPPEVRNALLNLSLATNADAVRGLRSGFAGAARKVRYFRAGDTPEPPDGMPDLRTRVLGPPSDRNFLKRMDPPAAQRYLRLSRGKPEAANPVVPFVEKWEVDKQAGRKALGLRADDELDLSKVLDESINHLALALDSIVNNTSLVLLFDFLGHTLLFPGDAQWGNWQAWLEAPGSDALLGQLSFLKVAHHGSHNATPKRALEGMTTGAFAAMASTQSSPWKSIPLVPLMTRLGEKTRQQFLRSDSLPVAGAPAGPPLPKRLPAGFRRGDFWIDYVYRL